MARPPTVAPNQPFALKDFRQRGRDDEVFANEFGVAADGTDQTVNLQRAVAHATSRSLRLVIPPGTYNVHDWTVSTAGAAIRGFGPNTVIRRLSGTTPRALSVTAADVTISDLSIDGTSGESGAAGSGALDIRAAGCTVRNVTVVDARSRGIRVTNGSHTLITDCVIDNPISHGIEVNPPTAVNVSDVAILGCRIDKSSQSSSATEGIKFTGAAAVDWIGDIRIVGNMISLPAGATDGLCIEVWGDIQGGTIAGNTTNGGRMGISTDRATGVTVTGNSVNGNGGIGIEFAGSVDCTCSGNTIRPSVGSGVSASASADKLAISGNVIVGVGAAQTCIHVHQSDRVSVSGNTLVAASSEGLLRFQSCEHAVAQGNLIDGVTSGSTGHGIMLENTASFAVSGNLIRNRANGITFFSNDGSTYTGPITGNNMTDGVTTPFNEVLSGGSVVTGLVRWANAGVKPSIATAGSVDALLIAQGVVQA